MPPQSFFIGREKYRVLFQENCILEKGHRYILSVSGQYGVGKTEFLRYCRRYAKSKKIITIWIDYKDYKDPLDVMDLIAGQFKEQKQNMKLFSEDREKYKFLCYKLNGNDMSSNSPARRGLDTLRKYGINLTKVYMAGSSNVALKLIGDLLPFDEVTKEVQDLVCRIFEKRLEVDDLDFLQNPVKKLQQPFFKDLSIVSKKHPVILFFDAHENCSKDLDDWLSSCVEMLFGDTTERSPHIGLVIAGQDDLSSRWTAYQHLRKSVKLDLFTPEEVNDFIEKRQGMSDHKNKRIYHLPYHLPLIIAIVAQAPDHVDVGTAITNYILLDEAKNEEKRTLIVNASLPRVFNKDILDALLTEQTPEKVSNLFQWLQKQPFVGKSYDDNPREGWFYDDVTRFYLSNDLRQATPTTYRDLHQRIIDYYKYYQEKLKLDPAQQYSSKRWLDAELEIIYHSLCLDPEQGIYTVSSHFLKLFQVRMNYGFRWAKAIQEAGRDTNNDDVLQIGKLLVEGMEAYAHKDDQSTITTIGLISRGYVYYLTKKFNLAVRDFCHALERLDNTPIQEREAILNDLQQLDKGCEAFLLGLLNHRKRDFHNSLLHFNNALAWEPQNAWAVIGRYFTLRRTGNFLASDKEYERACSIDPDAHRDSETMCLINTFMMFDTSLKKYIHIYPKSLIASN